MMKKWFLFTIFFVSIFLNNITAQRFQGGLIGGVNLSELSGDDISSYVGLHTGITAKAKIGRNWLFSTEMLYSQAGEYVLPEYYPPANYGRIRLNYLEVPIYFSALAFDQGNYFQKHFNFGISYARLLNYKAEDVNGIDLTEQLIYKKKNTILGFIGVSHYFNENLGLDFRGALAKNSNTWAWTLSFRAIYLL